jgi:molybdopterin-containing oxidoreductase family membrane subunit
MTTISPSSTFDSEPPARTPGRGRRSLPAFLWVLWAALAVGGVLGVVQRFTQGHLPAGYGSYVPWGLWIALYFHGVGIAGGAFVVGALGYILDAPGFRRPAVLRAVIVLSLGTVAAALLGVWFDLGHMERAHRIFTAPSFTSMMAFNAWMYAAFAVAAAAAWALSFRAHSSWLKPVLCLGIFFAVLYPSQSGAFFGVVDAKPYWHSALLPVLFLTSAVTAGSAMLIVVLSLLAVMGGGGGDRERVEADESAAAVRRLRFVVLAGLVLYFVLEFAEFSVHLWNPTEPSRAIELVLWGPYWWVFWVVHLLLGGVVPLALLSLPRRPAAWAAAALLVAVTFVSTRLNVLVPGQAVGEIRGLQDAFIDDRLNYIYHPTLMEYLVGLFLLAVGVALFFVGRRVSALVASRIARRRRAPAANADGGV